VASEAVQEKGTTETMADTEVAAEAEADPVEAAAVAAEVEVSGQADPERCTRQPAQTAARKRKCLLYLQATGPYTAESASRSTDLRDIRLVVPDIQQNNKYKKINIASGKAFFCFARDFFQIPESFRISSFSDHRKELIQYRCCSHLPLL
jgi:hypothetical protein